MTHVKLDYRSIITMIHRTIRPIGVYDLRGLTSYQSKLLSLDSIRGYLLHIDAKNDNTTILNPNELPEIKYANGLAIWENTLWFTRDHSIYACSLDDFRPRLFATLPFRAEGIAVWGTTVYVSCKEGCYIQVFNDKGRMITQLRPPGVGVESLTIRHEELWVADKEEQTVYCMDRATGEIKFSFLTPFDSPTGLVFYQDPATSEELLYVSYASEKPFIRDDPNSDPPLELAWRDRTFIHPLYYSYNPDGYYSLSNGYLIEMSYVEELSPLDAIELKNLQWRIALPSETARQKVRSIEAIGLEFTEEIQEGQKVAVFNFDHLKPYEKRIFGWKALIEVYSIKYSLVPLDVEKIPTLEPDLQQRYLIDDDNLAMDTAIVREAAQQAVSGETNFLRRMISLRNYAYDRLSYRLTTKIETPDVVLSRGAGSCGEYVGVLLALARLNGIACRTIGRYKCPASPEYKNVPLEPDYNHVWLEFYIPSIGWVPMESNPDDMEDGNHLSRFFMGLAWYHIEIGKGIPFERIRLDGKPVDREQLSVGDLALNHVRFTILEEIAPPEFSNR
ncbi:MAG: transglutaminase family protein [Roseofilum sp. Belize BBD 4]|nr:transglutaminase family protein [Roseofilum sp. Belize Diploria]MBP0034746.1 transglutaminase family protein [Roseofilum sp. Belize BBD 4]HBQ99246.1 transglutaminase [Cyanobacteria bacterium UBA11691]